MRIAVVGGRGHLGTRTVEALRRAGDEVAVAGRRGPVVVDLTRPETFAALGPYEVVIDLASTGRTPAEPLATWCLAHGKTFVEASSERGVVEPLLALRGRQGPGRIVLGGGIFTGLSNLLAAAAARAVGRVTSITFGAASHPYSGAGPHTVALMATALATPSLWFIGGRAEEGPPIAAGTTLPFPLGDGPALRAPLPEAAMLRASTGAPEVRVYLAPRPALLQRVFLSTPARVLRSGWFAASMRAAFTAVRTILLAWRASPVELVAVARGDGGEATFGLHVRDGMGCGGAALAAIARACATSAAGVRVGCVDEVLGLDTVLAETNRLATPAARAQLVRREPVARVGAA